MELILHIKQLNYMLALGKENASMLEPFDELPSYHASMAWAHPHRHIEKLRQLAYSPLRQEKMSESLCKPSPTASFIWPVRQLEFLLHMSCMLAVMALHLFEQAAYSPPTAGWFSF